MFCKTMIKKQIVMKRKLMGMIAGILLLLGACAGETSTTFTFLYPATEKRTVELEVAGERESLVFEVVDSLRRATVTLPLDGGEYARLWVGDMPYTVWMEAGKPWTAEFKWNAWRFTGEGAAANTYLNGHFRNGVLFYDYYRIPNTQFREKLDRMIGERMDSLRVVALGEPFTGLERKRLRCVWERHLASGVVYGEWKDGQMEAATDTRAELEHAVEEDAALRDMPDYLDAKYMAVAALARWNNPEADAYDQVLMALRLATGRFRDERTVSYLVERTVMKYLESAPSGDMAEMDAAFRRWVKDSTAVAAYEAIVAKARALAKGRPAAEFAFTDMEGDTVRLSDFRGRYVYVDLWATWCGPCNAEIPHLKRLEERMRGRNIAFVGMSSDRDREAWASFVRERGLGGTQLFMGDDDSFLRAVHCEGIPRFLLIDPEGRYVNADMTRPSNPATLATLEALPGI